MIYPWQKSQWNQLLQAFQQKRLSHAYVLSGMKGLGKNDFALAWAAFLLCEHPNTGTGECCDHCLGCQWMRAKTHPDYFHITPHEKNHSIKIDQIRELSEKITQKSQCGGYQVVVISPVLAMPIAASNALLKTLEEPLGKTVFLLVCDQLDRLLPTIKSRCQPIVFRYTNEMSMMRWLKQQYGDEQDMAVLLTISGGAPLQVKSLIENHYLSLRDHIAEHLFTILNNKQNSIVSVSQWMSYDVNFIFYVLLTIGVDISRIKMGVLDYVINQDKKKLIQKIADHISLSALERWMQCILEKKRLLAQGINLNTQLLFENLMIEWEKCGVY